jgi:hypothetical protein
MMHWKNLNDATIISSSAGVNLSEKLKKEHPHEPLIS